MKTIYCEDYDTLMDIVDILIRDGYKITIEYRYDTHKESNYEIKYIQSE